MRIVCLGGGHGLHATLEAVRLITHDVTAIVCVGDDGGSSGRLRDEFGVLPPGDIRMALSALATQQARRRGVVELLQHRFTSEGDLNGHALGNLILTAQWQRSVSVTQGIREVQHIFGIEGTVVPSAAVPLTLSAQVEDPHTGDITTIYSQRNVAKAEGRILDLRVEPHNPPACDEAVAAILDADIITCGPGSWYSSLLVHMLVPQLRHALSQSKARKILLMNLIGDAETTGLSPQGQLETFDRYSQGLCIDAILADEDTPDGVDLQTDAAVFRRRLALRGKAGIHDPVRLASGLKDVIDYFEQNAINR